LQSRQNLQTIKRQLVMVLRMVQILLKTTAMKILISEEVILTKAQVTKTVPICNMTSIKWHRTSTNGS